MRAEVHSYCRNPTACSSCGTTRVATRLEWMLDFGQIRGIKPMLRELVNKVPKVHRSTTPRKLAGSRKTLRTKRPYSFYCSCPLCAQQVADGGSRGEFGGGARWDVPGARRESAGRQSASNIRRSRSDLLLAGGLNPEASTCSLKRLRPRIIQTWISSITRSRVNDSNCLPTLCRTLERML